ncbi:hypothetical protein NDU88_002077 [Pleurodeles waltl]|uniref:Uncharacterized protein n=1 Tax=Pleurodeles waltl TaxID=8319 RepID=A0AAV7T1Q6_PLEWA|nr:hypothetical protein NDU88_002077 [Pleurodeles waltl]
MLGFTPSRGGPHQLRAPTSLPGSRASSSPAAALRSDSLAGESSARPPNDHGAGIGARTTHRTGPATRGAGAAPPERPASSSWANPRGAPIQASLPVAILAPPPNCKVKVMIIGDKRDIRSRSHNLDISLP